MSDIDNTNRLEKEIANFTRVLEQGGVSSSIPPIFTYWANKYLSPRLVEVFGDSRINFIFANEIFAAYKRVAGKRDLHNHPFKVISLGSGDCTTEIEVVKFLKSFGCKIQFVCTDLNPSVSRFAEQLATQHGVDEEMQFLVLDLNQKFPEGHFDAVMASHSLHHFVGLEFIFDNVANKLNKDGIFVISDMIGRNGHMRWPEALIFVEQLWNLLPDTKKFNFFAKCCEPIYVNYDCTLDDTFEGVRAQDILPLLSSRFSFEKFVGHGNVIDVFIDRIYGRNFSPDDPADTKFIDYVDALNTSLISAGVIKPTAMFATLSTSHAPCIYSKWSPEFSLRKPNPELGQSTLPFASQFGKKLRKLLG